MWSGCIFQGPGISREKAFAALSASGFKLASTLDICTCKDLSTNPPKSRLATLPGNISARPKRVPRKIYTHAARPWSGEVSSAAGFGATRCRKKDAEALCGTAAFAVAGMSAQAAPWLAFVFFPT